MKSNKKLNIISRFKYWMLIPIVLLVVSIIFGFVFGLNYDYDFKTVSSFDVKFNTTVTNTEYKELSKQLKTLVKSEFTDFRIEKIGDGAQNGLLVKIANEYGEFDTQIETLKNTIETKLLENTGDKLTSPVTITTTDTYKILPKDVSSLIGYSVLALACIMLFVFIYYAIRYNLTASVSIVLTILFEIAMLLTVMIVARIPFNYYFVVSYFVMTISTIIISSYLNNYIRSNLNVEKYNKYSNADRVYDAYARTIKPIMIFVALLSLSLFAIMFFGNSTLIYTMLSIIVSLMVGLFGIYFFEFSIWSFWYKKDKDATLKRKIEAENKKSTQTSKTDDKIVV